MKGILTIRYVALALILAGFFLPWLDKGEETWARGTLSGLEFAIGQNALDGHSSIKDFLGGTARPELFAILFLGLLLTANNNPKHTLLVLFLSIYFIVFCSPSGTSSSGASSKIGRIITSYHLLDAGLSWRSASYNYWAFGKVLTVIGFVTLLATSFLKQYRDPFLDFKTTKFIMVASWVIIAHLILFHLIFGGDRAEVLWGIAMLMAALLGVLKCIFISIRFFRRS